MKGEKSRISPAKKIVSTQTKDEKEERREREAVKEREKTDGRVVITLAIQTQEG